MRLVDTSAWIEWLLNTATGHEVGRALPPRKEWLVPTIVQLELVKWLARECGDDEVDKVLAFTERCAVVDLDSRLARLSAEAGARHKLATADAIVYATAQAHGAELIACDQHFAGLPDVYLIAKG